MDKLSKEKYACELYPRLSLGCFLSVHIACTIDAKKSVLYVADRDSVKIEKLLNFLQIELATAGFLMA